MSKKLLLNVLALTLGCLTAQVRPVWAGWVQQDSGTEYNFNDVTANHSTIEMSWACGDHGTIVFTSDGGRNWQHQESGTTADLHSLAYIEAEGAPVIAVGDSGVIVTTWDSGATWTRDASPTSLYLNCIADDGLEIVGDSGIILVRHRLTDPWEILPSPTTRRLNAVSGFFAPLIVSGDSGLVIRKWSATEWQVCSTGTGANLYGIPMFSVADLVVGDGGLILRSGDFGLHWRPQAAPVTVNLRGVEFSSNNTSHAYIVGDGGTILKTTNNGATWATQPSGTTRHLRGVFFYLDDANGYVVGDSGTILRTRDGGALDAAPGRESAAVAGDLVLEQNYPNPFNPVTTIHYNLARSGSVNVKVFDLTGREVASLFEGAQSAGAHRVEFSGAALPSGVYLCRVTTQGATAVRKMLLLK